ncbi:hypothetical protein CIHG_07323 [Coccidioides immitis H538.4]|uniref:Uncharacterized protein n=1 Tax=Coccidioides immitis H538.4 TaxID=396776 RepID=A0A0J8RY55_COCIT|nr:hypothetical protein CIHG_07323 [Coccidioides immitis H538.4]
MPADGVCARIFASFADQPMQNGAVRVPFQCFIGFPASAKDAPRSWHSWTTATYVIEPTATPPFSLSQRSSNSDEFDEEQEWIDFRVTKGPGISEPVPSKLLRGEDAFWKYRTSSGSCQGVPCGGLRRFGLREVDQTMGHTLALCASEESSNRFVKMPAVKTENESDGIGHDAVQLAFACPATQQRAHAPRRQHLDGLDPQALPFLSEKRPLEWSLKLLPYKEPLIAAKILIGRGDAKAQSEPDDTQLDQPLRLSLVSVHTAHAVAGYYQNHGVLFDNLPKAADAHPFLETSPTHEVAIHIHYLTALDIPD